MKLKDFIEELQNHYLPDTEVVPIFWQAEDVFVRAHDRGISLTEDEIRNIVDALSDNHDASVGINWDVIDFHLDGLDSQREGDRA